MPTFGRQIVPDNPVHISPPNFPFVQPGSGASTLPDNFVSLLPLSLKIFTFLHPSSHRTINQWATEFYDLVWFIVLIKSGFRTEYIPTFQPIDREILIDFLGYFLYFF
jgi:hypothetical protein